VTNPLKNIQSKEEFEVQLALGTINFAQIYEVIRLKNTPEFIIRAIEENKYKIQKTLQNRFQPANLNIHIAAHPNTPKDILEKYSRSAHAITRRSVAGNPNTPENVLYELSKDSIEFVVDRVAINPNTPQALLIRLSKHPHSSIRSNVICNKNVPISILIKLRNDSTINVLEHLIQSPRTPLWVKEECIKKLKRIEYPFIKNSPATFNKKKSYRISFPPNAC